MTDLRDHYIEHDASQLLNIVKENVKWIKEIIKMKKKLKELSDEAYEKEVEESI